MFIFVYVFIVTVISRFTYTYVYVYVYVYVYITHRYIPGRPMDYFTFSRIGVNRIYKRVSEASQCQARW